MGTRVSSADPAALRRYAGAADRLDARLVQLALDLGPGSEGATVPGAAGVARELVDLARMEAASTRWVGAVATAFAAADAGSGIGPWLEPIVVASLVELAGRPGSARAAELVAWLEELGAGPGVAAGAAEALGPVALGELVRDRPDLVGPVDGMPVAARVAANRRLIAAAVATAPDPVRRRRLTALLRRDPATGRPRQILLFDPASDGRVAEVFGDLERATSVAVLVPGMGTDLDDFDRTFARPAADLAARAKAIRAADGSVGSVAVVAWLGYDPPDGWSRDVGELAAAIGPERAREGGQQLVGFLAGLPSVPGRHVTLVGHSYGSTTVVAALQAGADPDDVVVMGSPGTLVERTDDLHRPDTGFFVLAAHHDVVTDLGWFGPSPSRPGSGFEPLAADGEGHSSYLVDGSRSQANVAAVILGRDDLLAPG